MECLQALNDLIFPIQKFEFGSEYSLRDLLQPSMMSNKMESQTITSTKRQKLNNQFRERRKCGRLNAVKLSRGNVFSPKYLSDDRKDDNLPKTPGRILELPTITYHSFSKDSAKLTPHNGTGRKFIKVISWFVLRCNQEKYLLRLEDDKYRFYDTSIDKKHGQAKRCLITLMPNQQSRPMCPLTSQSLPPTIGVVVFSDALGFTISNDNIHDNLLLMSKK
ncbi:12493_t:CDS:2 [Ambispora gerdemannii]|uniref:12493_t:CDS:1 n=1 Tax=Ambispora gerdemannii TaxID=144530 RepID=A0A9N8V147_9GLOM|nr:12493_t:CDS:2 [Ambispora gerdemannii]